MVLTQIVALVGVAFSFVGSVYLATRVFNPMVSLKNILVLALNITTGSLFTVGFHTPNF